jgi:hypothetical protein
MARRCATVYTPDARQNSNEMGEGGGGRGDEMKQNLDVRAQDLRDLDRGTDKLY